MSKKIKAKGLYIIVRSERVKKSILLANTGSYDEKENWLKDNPLMVVSVGDEVEGVSIGDRVMVQKAGRYDWLVDLLEEKPDKENITYFAAKKEDIIAIIE